MFRNKEDFGWFMLCLAVVVSAGILRMLGV